MVTATAFSSLIAQRHEDLFSPPYHTGMNVIALFPLSYPLIAELVFPCCFFPEIAENPPSLPPTLDAEKSLQSFYFADIYALRFCLRSSFSLSETGSRVAFFLLFSGVIGYKEFNHPLARRPLYPSDPFFSSEWYFALGVRTPPDPQGGKPFFFFSNAVCEVTMGIALI